MAVAVYKPFFAFLQGKAVLPSTLFMDYANIPDELQKLNQWVCSALPTKRPVQPNGSPASCTDARTFSSFVECCRAATSKGWGIGFVFTEDDPYSVIDLDHVRDAATGITEDWALSIVHETASYSEISMSGTGWHIVVRGTLTGRGNKAGRVEMYSQRKVMTLTGNVQHYSRIRIVDLASIHKRLGTLDSLHIAKPTNSGRKTKQITGGKSASERDYATIAFLYMICGRVDDANVIEEAFQRRYPDQYNNRIREKGMRGPVNYIRYSIDKFLKERVHANANRSSGTNSSIVF